MERPVRIDGPAFVSADPGTGRGTTVLGYPTQKIAQAGRSETFRYIWLEFAVCVLPLIGGRDRFDDVPMLNLLAVLDPVQVVEGRRLGIEKPLTHHKDEVSLPQNLVDLGVLEDEARLRKNTARVLKSGFIVFTIAVVLVEIIPRPVLQDLVPLTAEHDIIEVPFHKHFVGIGFIEVGDFRRTIELSAAANIWSFTFILQVVPMLDNFVAGEPEDVEAHPWTAKVVISLRDHIIAIGEDPHRMDARSCRRMKHQFLEGGRAVGDPQIVLNIRAGIDVGEGADVSCLQALQKRGHPVDLLICGQLGRKRGRARNRKRQETACRHTVLHSHSSFNDPPHYVPVN